VERSRFGRVRKIALMDSLINQLVAARAAEVIPELKELIRLTCQHARRAHFRGTGTEGVAQKILEGLRIAGGDGERWSCDWL
jgi:hypothetical protein